MIEGLINRFQHLSAPQRSIAAYLFLVLAVFISYANVYHYEFLLDDQSLMITNVFLRDWKHFPDLFTNLNYGGSGADKGFYRPIEQTFRMITFQMFGLSEPAFHALNVILHAINAMLVYRLGRALGLNTGAVFAASLLWALHPAFTIDVTYMSSTAELLWTTFALGALIVLLPDFTLGKIAIALVLVLLGLGSKETMVVFPALATMSLFLVSEEKKRLKPSTYIVTLPFWVLSAIYGVTYHLLNDYNVFHPGESAALHDYAENITTRIMTFLATLPTYLGVIFYPFNLHMERVFHVFDSPFAWPVLAGAVMAGGALAQIIIGRGKRGAALTFGFVWFAAVMSPVSGIFFPNDALISDGWLYTPTIGLALGVGHMLSGWISKLRIKQAETVVACLVAVIAVALSLRTFNQNKNYENPAVFYQHIFDCGGFQSRAFPDLGDYYLNRREFDKAAYYFQLAINNPNERNIPSVAMHAQLALAYLGVVSDEYYMITPQAVQAALPTSTKIPEAIHELTIALRMDPDFYFAHTILSNIYRFKGEEKTADYHYQKMLSILRKQGKLPE